MTSNTTPDSELDLLLTSLSSAVDALQSSLKAQELPSFQMDDTTPHPLDFGLPDPVSWYSRKAIVGLCSQIIALVQNPSERIRVASIDHMLPAALNVVVESDPPISDLITKAGPYGIHVNDLAKETGMEAASLGSIFRVLTSAGYFKEVSLGRYSLNRPASALVSGRAGSIFACIGGGPLLGAASALSPTVRGRAAQMPGTYQHSAFQSYYGISFFQWLQQNEFYARKFQSSMLHMELVLDPGLLDDYSWTALGEKVTLVDIGSGHGGLTLELLRRFDGWNAILQDKHDVVLTAEQHWRSHAPEIVKEGRVIFHGADFFQPTSLPPSTNERPYVFLLKNVLHNWQDGPCIDILKNLGFAAVPGTRLLVIGYCPAMPLTDSPRPSVEEFFVEISGKSMPEIQELDLPVPKPLLPGWGSGWVAAVDPLMLALFKARGRTEADYRDILQKAAWDLIGVTELRASACILNAVKV